ncbi:putative quinol monooxygenase [Nonomuraea sp. SBT364]|uniref:putative quinol monooxygenase n=1 Tax=Nonomuraea sp. SBT364 TaxID=1580530 RepID=UPI00066EB9A4|nr:putative quinol monooxygenase [Nonomuraea sp. SBT364]
MFVVIVHLRARPDRLGTFLTGIEANARATRREPGCLRIDVVRADEDPHRFILYEIYRDRTAFFTEHRSAAHYAAWRQIAEECVTEHRNTFCHPVSLQGKDS